MNTDLAAQKAMDRLAKEGPAALSEWETTLLTAWQFESGVSNTGFQGYFSSDRGDLAFNAPAALRAIGANRMAELAAEANAIFGDGGPPRERDARREFVRTLPESTRHALRALDDRYFACVEDIDELLEVFLARMADV